MQRIPRYALILICVMNAAISSGLECWGQYDDTQHQSSSWATQMLASAIVSDCRGFCVQYEAQLDGVNFTSGGCLGQLIGQSAGLDVISCEWDGQKKVVVAPFLGQGPSVPLTVYCCTTHLCNGCSHGLSPVTGFSAAIRSTDHGDTEDAAACGAERCAALEARVARLEDAVANAAAPKPEVFECNVRPPFFIDPSVKTVAKSDCPVPSPEKMSQEGFTCKFKDLGWSGHYAGLGVRFPPGAWPPTEKRIPSITVFATEDHHHAAPSDAHEDSEIAGVMIDFQPSPIKFLKNVTLTLPVYELESELHRGRQFVAGLLDKTTMKWVNGSVIGETDTFSLYAAISYPEPRPACDVWCILGIVAGVLALLSLAACCFCRGNEHELDPDELARLDLLYYYFHSWLDKVDEKSSKLALTRAKVARLGVGGAPRRQARGVRAGGGPDGRAFGGAADPWRGILGKKERSGVNVGGLEVCQSITKSEVQSSTTRFMAGASEVDVATAEEIILASEELDRLVSELHHRESFRAADVHKLV